MSAGARRNRARPAPSPVGSRRSATQGCEYVSAPGHENRHMEVRSPPLYWYRRVRPYRSDSEHARRAVLAGHLPGTGRSLRCDERVVCFTPALPGAGAHRFDHQPCADMSA